VRYAYQNLIHNQPVVIFTPFPACEAVPDCDGSPAWVLLRMSCAQITRDWTITDRSLSKVIDIFGTGSFCLRWNRQRQGIPRETLLIRHFRSVVHGDGVLWLGDSPSFSCHLISLYLSLRVDAARRLEPHHRSIQCVPHLHCPPLSR
jgi:hypothetical protein